MPQRLTFFLSAIFFAYFISGCSSTLVKDTYQHALDSDDYKAAFFTLSNLEIPNEELEKIQRDYQSENDSTKKYYYEFLLAKATQEKQYIDSFIDHSVSQAKELSVNDSQWISISNPLYDYLSLYGYSDDKALLAMISVLTLSDSANLSVVVNDLNKIYQSDTDRFIRIARDTNLNEMELLDLLEE